MEGLIAIHACGQRIAVALLHRKQRLLAHLDQRQAANHRQLEVNRVDMVLPLLAIHCRRSSKNTNREKGQLSHQSP